MKNTKYELTYSYYQYNSGACDNGSYQKTIIFEDKEKALCLFDKFSKSIAKTLSDNENQELINTYIPYDGYFTDVRLVEVIRDELVLGEKGNLTHHQKYVNTSFSNCECCYSQAEGYSVGCKSCDHTGNRVLNAQSMELAQSAKEWADDQVQALWSQYNQIFKLNMGLTQWSISGKTIFIEAGYSCRGSYSGFDYELPVEWLYAKNQTQLIQAAYDEKEAQKKTQELKSQQERLARLKAEAKILEKQLGQ